MVHFSGIIPGSVTPKVLHRVFLIMIYSFLVIKLNHFFPLPTLSLSPFQYTGFALSVLLVLRINAGLERWWEARKLWGQILNQSRNLAIIISCYCNNKEKINKLLNYISCWPYVIMSNLRNQEIHPKVSSLLEKEDFEKIIKSEHKPALLALKIDSLVKEIRDFGLDNYSYNQAQNERFLLLDAVGACERISSTPIPFVLAIKIRRFILLFLVLLPFCLSDKNEFYTSFICVLVAYPLLSLDEIGIQLQNPFSIKSLSCLPIEEICQKICDNILKIKDFND
ncbi:bestrophin family protein [Silvanigrella sp.]|uniref:bestrophin family protein n=1 Tax=Silvanigrella sp. TaxID=2024976 RepID=UPI0037C71654